MIDFSRIDTLSKAYAHHNRLHAEYLDARHTARKKQVVAEEHEALVRWIIGMGGRHLAKGEALDETLPQELQKPMRMRSLMDSIELAEGNRSPRVQILRTGTFFHSVYGKFVITDETLEQMVKNFQEVRPKAPTQLVVDYEHESAEENKRAEAAGWIESIFKEDGGLFASIDWTDDAAGQIEAKKYRFISPEFDLNYRHKETNKSVGACVLAAALTNRPFLEGMEPVILSEALTRMICTEEVSFEEQSRKVRGAYDSQFRTGTLGVMEWVADVYDDYCIIEREGKMFKLPYTEKEGGIDFHKDQEVQVQKTYQPIGLSEIEGKEWDTAYINDLPDSAFAFIRPGGEKDEDGKTKPRSLRYLPYKDSGGGVDLPHLRNALSRLPQTNLTLEEKAKARAVLVAAAKEAGVGEYTDVKEEAMEQELRELLGIDETANVVDTVRHLKEENLKLQNLAGDDKLAEVRAENVNLQQQVTDLTAKLEEETKSKALHAAEGLVEKAMTEGKLVPAQKEAATALALRDPSGFEQFLSGSGKVLALGELGGEAGDLLTLSEVEKATADKLGVSHDELAKSKAAHKDE